MGWAIAQMNRCIIMGNALPANHKNTRTNGIIIIEKFQRAYKTSAAIARMSAPVKTPVIKLFIAQAPDPRAGETGVSSYRRLQTPREYCGGLRPIFANGGRGW